MFANLSLTFRECVPGEINFEPPDPCLQAQQRERVRNPSPLTPRFPPGLPRSGSQLASYQTPINRFRSPARLAPSWSQ